MWILMDVPVSEPSCVLLRNTFYSCAIFALGAALCKSNIPWDVETVGSPFKRMLMTVTERQVSGERNYQVWMGHHVHSDCCSSAHLWNTKNRNECSLYVVLYLRSTVRLFTSLLSSSSAPLSLLPYLVQVRHEVAVWGNDLLQYAVLHFVHVAAMYWAHICPIGTFLHL